MTGHHHADDRAVSSTAGVAVLVALTVVLVGVIGAMVVGLTGSTAHTPRANFTFDQRGGAHVRYVAVTDVGGATLEYANVHLLVDGHPARERFDSASPPWSGTGSLSPGASTRVRGYVDAGRFTHLSSGNTVSVVWSSGDGQTTRALANYTVR